VTAEERRAYIRTLVYAAPPLSADDARRIRRLVPLQSRLAAERAATAPRQRTVRPAA
jgi:hypothetical protein